RDHVAVYAAAFLGEPGDEAGGIDHFTLRLGEDLALLDGHDDGEVISVFNDQVGPAVQDIGALFGGQLGPRRLGSVGGFNSAPCLGTAAACDLGDQFTGRGVQH